MHEAWFSTCAITVAILSGFALYFEFDSIGLMTTLPIKSWSKYYQESSAELKTCYEEKMRLLGYREDPYSCFESKGKTSDSNSLNCTRWPEVTYPDIYNYLILTPGITHEQLKAFKSMEGYNFYISGKVNNINVSYQVQATKIIYLLL